MPCDAGSSLIRLGVTTSLDRIIFSSAGFNLLLFCAATSCAGLQPRSRRLHTMEQGV